MKKALEASAIALALWLVSIPAVHAAELFVRYSLQTVEGTASIVKGTIDVTVSNATKDVLRNVDLRLAQPGPNAIEKPLLQFGTIPPGEARIAKASFIFDSAFHASGAPLTWRVEYDAGGTHHQVVVPGIQIRR